MSLPRLATAAATMAICSGVTRRLYCPIAVRAGSIGSFGPCSLPCPSAPAGGRDLVGGQLERRVA